MNFLTSIILLAAILSAPLKASDNIDEMKNIAYRKQCLNNKEYIVRNKYSVSCLYNYHHYNSVAYKSKYRYGKAIAQKNIKIAGFNLWHPGTSKTMFKDYEIIAKMINKWDVVGAVELLPVVSHDLRNNKAILAFIEKAPGAIEKAKEKLYELKKKNPSKTTNNSIAALNTKIAQLTRHLKEAPKLFRSPGYLKVLEQLRKLDKSWALILAPRGEAAKKTDVQELAGFFYRASVVRPEVNEYCKEIKTRGTGRPFGCIPTFGNKFMDRDYRAVFSRRPFMASFKSGNFDFTLLTSHIVFNPPKDEDRKKQILDLAFGVTDLYEIGTGVSKAKYARFAETKLTLKFIERLKEVYSEEDVILVGDFNLENSNPYWNHLLSEFPGTQTYVDAATSLTTTRYTRHGEATSGYASNYDHFIFNPTQTSECDGSSAKRESITSGEFGKLVDDKYLIRSKTKDNYGSYIISLQGKRRAENLIRKLEERLLKKRTIKRNKIVADLSKMDRHLDNYRRRVFNEQSEDKTYYKLYLETISDHAPISMSCKTE